MGFGSRGVHYLGYRRLHPKDKFSQFSSYYHLTTSYLQQIDHVQVPFETLEAQEAMCQGEFSLLSAIQIKGELDKKFESTMLEFEKRIHMLPASAQALAIAKP